MRTREEWLDVHRDDACAQQAYERGVARRAAKQIEEGRVCPECGSMDTEDNGGTEFRCRECDHRWGSDMGERYGY